MNKESLIVLSEQLISKQLSYYVSSYFSGSFTLWHFVLELQPFSNGHILAVVFYLIQSIKYMKNKDTKFLIELPNIKFTLD